MTQFLLVAVACLLSAEPAAGFSLAPVAPTCGVGRFAPANRAKPATNSQLFGSDNGDNDDAAARALQEKAAALRREVEEFEASKQQESDKLQQEADDLRRQSDERRLRYSAVVPILKGDGSVEMERCDFAPRLKPPSGSDDADTPAPASSRILAFQAPLPLGVVLGQDEEVPPAQRLTTIDAIADGGNGEAAGIRVGDVLRACTACQVTMEQPTWQLLAGGIGRPKTTRMMFGTDGKSFEEVMDAIGSNSMDPEERDIWLVMERMEENESNGDGNEE